MYNDNKLVLATFNHENYFLAISKTFFTNPNANFTVLKVLVFLGLSSLDIDLKTPNQRSST